DARAVHDRRAVDRGGAEEIAPHLLAGADLEGVDAAVAAAADDQPFAVDDRDHRRGVIGVARREAGRPPPADGAGALVEGDEAVAAAGLLAPAGVEHAQDDQVAVHHRAGDPAAVAADPAELLV